jgi:hypothetical protein
MKGRATWVAVAAIWLVPAAAAPSQPHASALTDEAFFHRAASCAAALEIDQQAMVARARAGAIGLRPALVDVTRLGFAYVGSAYLRGLRNPRGDELLAAARRDELARPADAHAAIVTACRAEASALFDAATALERWLVSQRAESRVDRYLARAASAPSAPAASRP